jgi:molecular chaperone GrpE
MAHKKSSESKENTEKKVADDTVMQDAVAEKEPETAENKTPPQDEAAKEQPQKEEVKVDPLVELQQQVNSWNDRYVRLMAEFDNYKKRISREYERQVESANEKLMIEMIDVRENFERALKSGSGVDAQVLFDGMKLIFNKFDAVLSNNGLETFGSVGDAFDPQIHDALMNAPKAEIPADHIADIYERGYKVKSKVIKHAKVIISSGAPADAVE